MFAGRVGGARAKGVEDELVGEGGAAEEGRVREEVAVEGVKGDVAVGEEAGLEETEAMGNAGGFGGGRVEREGLCGAG